MKELNAQILVPSTKDKDEHNEGDKKITKRKQ